MQRLLPISMMALLLLCRVGAWAGPYEDGNAAYERGDRAGALAQYQLAASQGDARAEYVIGTFHEYGLVVPKEISEALKWYRLAAEHGYAQAQHELGWISLRKKQYTEAMKWYKLAATQGYTPAYIALGLMYFSGEGTPQDYVRAHMWYNLGYCCSHSDSTNNKYAELLNSANSKLTEQGRKTSEEHMTPQQIAEAQKLARECQQRNFKDCD